MTEDSHKTGFGSPPTANRFKPGKSGNPKGRPKGIRNFKTELEEELNEKVLVREADRQFLIPKQRAIVKALVAAAINGDARAISTVLGFYTRDKDEQRQADADSMSAGDRSLVDRFLERELAKRERAKDQVGENDQTERKKDG
jgi:hypothetical protein